MVRSGLENKPSPDDVPRVSQYRLAAHLGTAFLLHALMLYSALGILLPPQQQVSGIDMLYAYVIMGTSVRSIRHVQ